MGDPIIVIDITYNLSWPPNVPIRFVAPSRELPVRGAGGLSFRGETERKLPLRPWRSESKRG